MNRNTKKYQNYISFCPNKQGHFPNLSQNRVLASSEFDAQPLIRTSLQLKFVADIDILYKKLNVLGQGGYSTVYKVVSE